MSDAPLTKDPQLSPCPFCGAGETVLEPDSKHWTGMRWNILSYRVRHWCSMPTATTFSVRVDTKGKTEQEAADLWNRRAT